MRESARQARDFISLEQPNSNHPQLTKLASISRAVWFQGLELYELIAGLDAQRESCNDFARVQIMLSGLEDLCDLCAQHALLVHGHKQAAFGKEVQQEKGTNKKWNNKRR